MKLEQKIKFEDLLGSKVRVTLLDQQARVKGSTNNIEVVKAIINSHSSECILVGVEHSCTGRLINYYLSISCTGIKPQYILVASKDCLVDTTDIKVFTRRELSYYAEIKDCGRISFQDRAVARKYFQEVVYLPTAVFAAGLTMQSYIILRLKDTAQGSLRKLILRSAFDARKLIVVSTLAATAIIGYAVLLSA
jgi:hypothetical protein